MYNPFLVRPRHGIKLDLRKRFTADLAIQPGPRPQRVLIPLLQHRGQAAEPCVHAGEMVNAGQKIGLAQGKISAHVHASVSGTVRSLISQTGFDGRVTPVIEIETSETLPALTNRPQTFAQAWQLAPHEIRALIAEAGIVGMGGAAFPTQLKLEIPSGKNVNVLVINGAECEPYINCDFRLMVEQPAELVEGIRLLQKALGQIPAYLGIETDKLSKLASLAGLCTPENKITLTPLPPLYPQGDETLLIQSATGRVIPGLGLPWDVGAVVLNVATVLAVRDAVLRGQPLVERVVTVAGAGVRQPGNLRIKIGTTLETLLEACGGVTGDMEKIIVGGPMMGFAQTDLHTPLTKATTGILALTRAELSAPPLEQPCIRCAKCTESCPFNLQPHVMYHDIKSGRSDKAKKHFLDYCVECGCCDYVCPARIPLVNYFRAGKKSLREAAK